MTSDKLRLIVRTLNSLPSFSAFVAEHRPGRSSVSAPTDAEIREGLESCVVWAVYKSIATGDSEEVFRDGNGHSSLKRHVAEMGPLVEEFGKLGIEVTFSKPVYKTIEAEDKQSGGDWWAIFLTAKRKS